MTTLSPQETAARVQTIADMLDSLLRSDSDISRWYDVEQGLSLLRQQYRQQPAGFKEHVQRLADLSRRFEEWLSQRLNLVVDRFHEVNQRLHLIEQEKTVLRELLIRRATQARQEHLSGASATVRVRTVTSRILPPTGTDERRQLEAVIRNSGLWEEASQLSRARLMLALSKGLFPPRRPKSSNDFAPRPRCTKSAAAPWAGRGQGCRRNQRVQHKIVLCLRCGLTIKKRRFGMSIWLCEVAAWDGRPCD